jgi:FMN phosphatase YigB (HAD superfamily)
VTTGFHPVLAIDRRSRGPGRRWPPPRSGTAFQRRDTTTVSFDVFDTTLTRLCGPPQALYLWLGRQLWRQGVVPVTPEQFAHARMRAEAVVWHRAGGMDAEVLVSDFHHEVLRSLLLEERHLATLIEAELRLEERVLRRIPSAAAAIAAARQAGRQVVFTTDTYFDAGFVGRQLDRAGVREPGDRCFVSADRAASKASGRLFDVLLDELSEPAHAVVHVGDNAHSDLRIPRRKGISGHLLVDGQLNRYERLLGTRMWESGGLAASFSGASREVRLKLGASDEDARAIRDVATGVAAPLIIGYVLWILHRAHDHGLQRLFFLARDGQLMARVAQILAPRLGLDIDVAYLYASRASTNLAGTFDVSEDDLAWVFRDRPSLSVDDMLARLDIAWDEVAGSLVRQGVERSPAPTPDLVAARLSAALRSDPLRDLVRSRASQRRRLVRAYLEQEGALGEGRSGIVDFGGVGSQVRALHSILSDAGAAPPELLLVGLDRARGVPVPGEHEQPEWLRDTSCYLYDHLRQRGIQRPRGFGTLMQMFCAADHDTVTGYRELEQHVVPVYGPSTSPQLRSWGVGLLHSAVAEVAATLVLDEDLVDPRGDLRGVSCELVALLWSDPGIAEARAWGSFPFEGAQASESEPEPLAAGYSWSGVARGVVRRSFPDLGWQHWFEASTKLSPPPIRTLIRLAERTYLRLDTSTHPFSRGAIAQLRRVLRPER